MLRFGNTGATNTLNGKEPGMTELREADETTTVRVWEELLK